MRWATAIFLLVVCAAGGCGDAQESDGSLPVTTIQRPERTAFYSVQSSSMEPTLHCARPANGCEAATFDRVETEEPAGDVNRRDIIVFETPPAARARCGAGGTFVSRLIGLPGERLELRSVDGLSHVYIDGKKLDEPYIGQSRRDARGSETFQIPEGQYFMMGDNRSSRATRASGGRFRART